MDLLLDPMEVLPGLPVETALTNMVLGLRRETEAAHEWVWVRRPERRLQREKMSQEIAEDLHRAARG